MNRQESREKAIGYLEASIASLAERLPDDRHWRRCRRLIDRLIKVMDYDWMWLHLLPYPEYLETDHWRKVRTEALERAKGKCQVCNGGGELHTHHRTYENIGSERDADLIVLCKRCHLMFHQNCKLAEQDYA